MPITLINHDNSPGWTEKNRRLAQQSNGAKIYSQAITKYYWSVFQEMFEKSKENVALVTVTLESQPQRFKGYDKIFIFLHECNWQKQPVIARAKAIAAANSKAQVIFIVWHEDTADKLAINGLNAIFVPMAIDLEEIEQNRLKHVEKYQRRILWFGHLRTIKKPYFKYFVIQANKMGWQVDYISNNRLNGNIPLTRPQVLQTIQRYKYGVGVGQCAQEMAAYGLKVILYAYNFKCNCPYTEEQAEYYVHRNLVSQEETNVLVQDAINRMNRMVVFTPVSIQEQAKELPKLLSKYKINSK